LADIISPEQRSALMSRIRGKNTKPEQLVRRGLFSKGFRFRLHDTKLSGKPDLVFPKYRTVLFVNGCFWHGHNCILFRMPSTNRAFWETKIKRNRENDASNIALLAAEGWKVITLWECAIRGKDDQDVSTVLDLLAELIRENSTEKVMSIAGQQRGSK